MRPTNFDTAIPVPETEFQKYLDLAKSFDFNTRKRDARSKKTAWIIAGISMIACIGSIGALASLAPLKSVEPFVIRVDKSTGIPEVMSRLSDGELFYSEALSRYFSKRYVTARESYVHATKQNLFRETMLLSGPSEQLEYSTHFNGEEEDSPQILYGNKTKVEIKPRSISFLSDDQLQVRYSRTEITDGVELTKPWVAIITFEYQPEAKIKESDRLINPLGFIVTDYQADVEVL